MSRTFKHSCGCFLCKPHKYTGERPTSEARYLTVEKDLDAIDNLHWTIAQDIAMDPAEWDCECASCEAVAETYRRYYRLISRQVLDKKPLTFKPFKKAA